MDPTLFFQNPIFAVWAWIFRTAIWWYPVVAVMIAWESYLAFIRANYISNINWVLLEIKIPKEISKSPAAMEVVLSQLYQSTEGSLIDKYIKGRVRSWFSLELVSIEGEVHFFIRTEAKFKNLVESNIYSQYPGVEIFESEDYTYQIDYGLPNSEWDYFGAEFKLTKADVFPIKTYVDYGLDKDPKEEFKIDPLSSVLEYLGSIGPGEQIWMQIPIMAARERHQEPGKLFKKRSWVDAGREEIDKVQKTGKYKEKDKEKAQFASLILQPGDRQRVEAMERSLSKLGYDSGYRGFYLAKKDNFKGTNISRLLGSTKQYGSENLNGFKLSKYTAFDYPWQDFTGGRLARVKKRMFDNYRRRAYFFPPAGSTVFVLNTEELATIYHFPGKVAEIPTLDRIASKRGEPPSNLPVG